MLSRFWPLREGGDGGGGGGGGGLNESVKKEKIDENLFLDNVE